MLYAAFAAYVQLSVLLNALSWSRLMTTLLAIEVLWSVALGSAIVYLLRRRTVAGGLSGAFIVLLGLGLWYGWRSASYLWALQWTVYAAGILLLWAWLALEAPLASISSRLAHYPAILALTFVVWGLSEALSERYILYSLPSVLPTLGDIGMRFTHEWAPIFVWLSVVLAVSWFLLLLSWKKSSV
ncbi:MAG: hypothetical protein N3E49_08900 [Bacteroidia bacterium]|nr:hypothetical protein [Bacteroidia bacterium]